MKKLVTFCFAICITISANAQKEKSVYLPAKFSKEEVAGGIFESKKAEKYEAEGEGPVINSTSMSSTDGKFATGMYSAGPHRLEYKDEPYGADEFMYFITGGITLTSEDGTVMEIGAGEAASIPAEWKGVWETKGYTKLWVIYSREDSALE